MIVINGKEVNEIYYNGKEVSSIMKGGEELWAATNFKTADNRTIITEDGKTFNVNSNGEVYIQVYRRGD